MDKLEETKELETPVLKVFDKVHNPTNESSEAEALELLSQLPNPAEVRDDDEYQYTLLHHACYNGWYEVAKVLIEKYSCDLNCRNAIGSIPLHLACSSGNLYLVRYLILDKGCDPSDVDKSGQSPLHTAAFSGHVNVMKFLTESCGMVSTFTSGSGWTPLHFACEGGHLVAAKYLIEEQLCNPALVSTNCQTLLHRACLNGHLDVAKYLIEEQQCDPAYRMDGGWTLLHFACQKGHLKVAEYLIEKHHIDQSIINDDCPTPLHTACLKGHLILVKYLTEEKRCDPLCKKNGGWTPLHYACEGGHLVVAKYLIEKHHTDPSVTNINYQTPLHCTCLKGHLHIAKYLTEGQLCNPACKANGGWTPLHYACQEGHLNIAEYLIKEQHVNPSIKTDDSQTPLHSACLKGHLRVVKYLTEKQQCDPACRKNSGWTPLHYACEGGHLTVIKYLIEEQNVDPSIKNDDFQTSLHTACLKGYIKIVKYLIEEQQCDPTDRMNGGWTPLHLVCQEGDLNLARYLIEDQHVNPSITKHDCRTPLHSACLKGHIHIVKYLIEIQQCNPVGKTNGGWTPLHYACQEGHLNVTKYLIEKQHTDPSINKDDYQTPLHSACLKGHLTVAKYLIEEQNCDPASVNVDFQTPLHFACSEGHTDVVQYLINEWQCDPIKKDFYGSSPFKLALEGDHMHTVTLIISSMYRGIQQNEILHLACARGDLEIVKFLIETQHFSPQSKNCEGLTPLHVASKYGHIDTVRYLTTTHRSSITCRDNDGSLPSSLAIANNHTKVALFLLRKEPGYCDAQDNNLLIHFACKAGHIINVKYLAKNFNPRFVRDSDGFTPLHIACENGYREIVKFLIQDAQCNPMRITSNAWTPLHSASQCGKLDIIKYLIKEQQCDPNCRTLKGMTPLHLASRNQHFNVVVYLVMECIHDFSSLPYYGDSLMEETLKGGNDNILIFLVSHGLQFTSKHSRINRSYNTRLVQPTMKVFVLGNSMSGKSTLVKALMSNLVEKEWFNFSKIFNTKVTGVEPHTAGIIPYHAHSPSCSQLILYDFAGQHEHYSSSHAATFEKLKCTERDLVFIVVDISRSKEQLVKELKYWNSFVSNQYCQEKPQIIVIGSHLDIAKLQGKQTLFNAMSELPHLKVSITLDCTRKSSSGLTDACKQISSYSKIHQETFKVSAQVHFLNQLLRKSYEGKIACQLHEVLDIIEHEDNVDLRKNKLLPSTFHCLSIQISKLCVHGEFLYIKNTGDIRQSWIIFRKEVLLSEINGSIFAPKEFKSVYKDLSSTGVVSSSKIKDAFPRYDHNMLMSFMKTLDFCHEIEKSDLCIINSNQQLALDQEQYYFFPALVSTDKCTDSCQAIVKMNYKFGWCLHCKGNVLFTSRFLQVLVLRLAFTFALPEISSTDKETSLEVERRKCNIWKNGIHWQNMNGVETIVEIVEQNTAVILIMGCFEGSKVKCIQLRSAVIEAILSVKKKYSSAVDAEESFLHPDELTSYPLRAVESLFTFPSSTLRTAIKERTVTLINKIGSRPEMIPIDTLLVFEPYTCLKEELICKLIDRSDQNKTFEDSDDDFINECAKVAHPKMAALKEILLLPEHDSEYNTAVKQCVDQFSDDPTHQCFHIFKTWQKFTPNPTYRGLREALDSFSIFRGRYPLP